MAVGKLNENIMYPRHHGEIHSVEDNLEKLERERASGHEEPLIPANLTKHPDPDSLYDTFGLKRPSRPRLII